VNFIKYPSLLLETAVNEFSKLPGIGNKTALRLVLHLLKQDSEVIQALSHSLTELSNGVRYCQKCFSISDMEICEICNDTNRNHSIVCVVESIKDVMAIENTQQYRGVYHVLGGIISPMDGVGPGDLTIHALENRIELGGVEEVVLALSTTMEGDTTGFYLNKKLNRFGIKMSIIARGVSFGDELEYTDEITLGRSIINRTPFDIAV